MQKKRLSRFVSIVAVLLMVLGLVVAVEVLRRFNRPDQLVPADAATAV